MIHILLCHFAAIVNLLFKIILFLVCRYVRWLCLDCGKFASIFLDSQERPRCSPRRVLLTHVVISSLTSKHWDFLPNCRSRWRPGLLAEVICDLTCFVRRHNDKPDDDVWSSRFHLRKRWGCVGRTPNGFPWQLGIKYTSHSNELVLS
jgi:hypothetical protein